MPCSKDGIMDIRNFSSDDENTVRLPRECVTRPVEDESPGTTSRETSPSVNSASTIVSLQYSLYDELVCSSDSLSSQQSRTTSTISSPSTLQQPTGELTVEGRWKVEEEIFDKEHRDGDRPSRLIPIAKWTVTILLGTAILCLFIASKLAFISLSFSLTVNQPTEAANEGNVKEWASYTGQFLVIYLVLAIPYFLLLVRAAWMGICTGKSPWPKKSAVWCCVAVGILEPNGLVLLALKVLPRYTPVVGAQLMATTVTLTVLWNTVQSFQSRSIRAITKMLMIGASICMFGGVLLVGVQVGKATIDKDIWHVIACVVSLNIAWLPWLHKHMSESETIVRVENRTGTQGSVTPLSGQQSMTSSTISSPSGSATHYANGYAANSRDTRAQRSVQKDRYYVRATGKATFILYLVKTFATFVLAFVYFYIDVDFSVEDSFSSAMHDAFLQGWDFASSLVDSRTTWTAFTVNLVGALVGYVLAFIALHTNMQRGGLALPSLLSLPLTVLILWQGDLCQNLVGHVDMCLMPNGEELFLWPAVVLLAFGQFFALGRLSLRKERIYLLKESELFWIPGYNGVILDSWLVLNRRQTVADVHSRRAEGTPAKTRVYICTTMYRESEDEMKQLLESLHKINIAQACGKRFFESHIIFDGGIARKKLSDFALVLISLLDETLGIKPATCTKIITPYGMKLSWALPAARGSSVMTFNIHLKDNKMVKNKKRWSQIMYMSYVLDFLSDTANTQEENYILTTDADVMFSPQSVEALLDLMQRDNTIGAVCARTHPMGSGPLVWYQKFEYAVGHWFQKAAEHVLGSVLCAPGCFSVYRCRALREVLPKYSQKVTTADDFLTKDMGEDRWLCTLLVQTGWRIEYCAASENSTNCPAEFEEFYKQRRRWIASTLANLKLIIWEWKYIRMFNQRVSVVFWLYQVLLFFSTGITPSTVILIVSGGLTYAWGFNSIAGLFLQIIMCIIYAIVCIYASTKTQMLWAKLYTFVYAMLMCAVAVGIALQVVTDIDPPDPTVNPYINQTISTPDPGPPSQHISIDIPVSVTTIYLGFLVSVFLLAGLLHPREFPCLVHGLWYLLCLPSAYLVLMIYSICNLTDSSWGTREGPSVSNVVKKDSWWGSTFKEFFYSVFFCCSPPQEPSQPEDIEVDKTPGLQRFQSEDGLSRPGSVFNSLPPTVAVDTEDLNSSGEFTDSIHLEVEAEEVPIAVEDWLPQEFRARYLEMFRRHGFDSTLFITALTESELNRMGITTLGHVQYLMSEISSLPTFELQYKVPTNVTDWLQEIGLPMYTETFRRNHIRTPKEMEILKRFDRKDIQKELGIKKEGHIKRLLYAIRMLRDPNEDQQKALRMRAAIEDSPVHYLKDIDIAEFDFWNKLKATCLEPDLKAFGIEAEIKVKLVELRNNWIIIMAVTNTLWLILISTLATKGELTVLGANAIGLVFLFVFGLLFIVQFFAMLVHRAATLSHYLARASYKFGTPFDSNWSFNDRSSERIDDTTDVDAIRQIKEDAERALRRVAQGSRPRRSASRSKHPSERTPLMGEHSFQDT